MMSLPDFKEKQVAFCFLNEGEKIRFKNDNILVEDSSGGIKHQSTCYRLFALFVVGNMTLTSGLLDRAKKFGFSIVIMNSNLRVLEMICSKAEGNTLLRKRQYSYFGNDIGAHIISNKIHNQCQMLRRNREKKGDYEKGIIKGLDLLEKKVIEGGIGKSEIMGMEGTAARSYFSLLFKNHNWKARMPRSKIDMVNTLMDIGYTMLFCFIDALLQMYGFDVYVGVLHTEFYHRKSLVCDLEEPFRPIVDYSILKMLNLGQVHEKDFYFSNNQYVLFGKNSAPYIMVFIRSIMEYKEEIFLYVQKYYRAFMRGKEIGDYPLFIME